MEIVKKKVVYTSFAALLLSGFTLQTAKAEDVTVSSEGNTINLATSEVEEPLITETQVSETSETVLDTVATSEIAPSVSASVAASESTVQISTSEAKSQSAASATSQEVKGESGFLGSASSSVTTSLSDFIKQVALVSSESQVTDTRTTSEQAKPDVVLTIDRSRTTTVTSEALEVSALNKRVDSLYTSELAGQVTNSLATSEVASVESLAMPVVIFSTDEDALISEVATVETSEAITTTEGSTADSESVTSTIMTVGWPDSTSTSSVFRKSEISEVISFLQSENVTYASEVMTEGGSTAEIVATPISSEVYTIVPTRDSTGAKIEDAPEVSGNTDVIYLARGEVFNVNFDVNKMNGTKIKGLNLFLDGKQIHHSLFIEGTLDDINAGLGDYHLAEQPTGIHKMSFELIDTNDNIHYLTQTFSVFNDGETPVTPTTNRVTETILVPVVYPSTNTTETSATDGLDSARYSEVATQIQTTAISELAEVTRTLTQQLASQIAEALSDLSQAIAGHAADSANSMDIFQAARHGVTQTAKKIAETISDPEAVGKQALAVATIALVLLVLYLAAITFI